MELSRKKRWLVLPAITPQADNELNEFSPIVRQVLFNRGYATEQSARAYLQGEFTGDSMPFLLMGMEKTTTRILAAIHNHERIAIYGDYDVDGVSATALLVQGISALGGEVQGYIPNRFDEGYGLNIEALTNLQVEGVKLVISVDCGIRSHAEARHALSIGLDLVITDHHQPATGELPPAFSIINPKQEGDPYPDKDLAGVGVAYKLAQGLFNSINISPSEFDLNDMLDLVALGTVSDLAPLVGENRTLVRNGLQKLQGTKRQGLFSLAAVSDLSLSSINATSIGFVLGPRLNAAGRLESAQAAYDLLITTDVRKAGELAQQLNTQNRQRQELTRRIQEAAESLALSEDPEALILFATHPDFNAGVVGLAASRLMEKYYRPAIVGQIINGTTRCSCRSIPEFHITEALDLCSDLLIRHGGHAAAAGFTIENKNIEPLKERLKKIARERLGEQVLLQTLTADMEVRLKDLRSELVRDLKALQPTGYGNPEAKFVCRSLKIASSRNVGSDNQHLKLVVTDGHISYDAIGFRLGHLLTTLPKNVDILFTFETNEYNGRSTLQLNLKDVKPAEI